MKTLKFKFLGLLFLGTRLLSFAAQSNSKEIHREIIVNPDVLVEIKNQFGDLNISSWDENKVVIDVVITVKGSNQKRVDEQLDKIDEVFNLSSDLVSAQTQIDEGWSYFWFNSSKLRYEIDYTVKLPRSSAVDLENDYGSILLNELDGSAKINCDYGKLLIGDLHHENNSLSFDYTTNSTIDFIKGGEIRADYSGFEVMEAGTISLQADYTNSKFNKIERLEFKNDYGKLNIDRINHLNGRGDFLTLQLGTLYKKLDLNQEFGSIRVDHINPSAEMIMVDSEYTGVTLGIDSEWDFTYKINLEFASLKFSPSSTFNPTRRNYRKPTKAIRKMRIVATASLSNPSSVLLNLKMQTFNQPFNTYLMKTTTLFSVLFCLNHLFAQTQTRNIDAFDGVNVAGHYDVTLVQGSEGSITLSGDSEDLDRIETYEKKENSSSNKKNHLGLTVGTLEK